MTCRSWPAILLLALCATPTAAQPAGRLLGRWEVVRIVDAQGRPDADSEGWVALTFSESGVLYLEFTPQARVDDPELPDFLPYRVTGDRLVLDVGGEEEYGDYHFEGDELRILDPQRGLTLHLRRSVP